MYHKGAVRATRGLRCRCCSYVRAPTPRPGTRSMTACLVRYEKERVAIIPKWMMAQWNVTSSSTLSSAPNCRQRLRRSSPPADDKEHGRMLADLNVCGSWKTKEGDRTAAKCKFSDSHAEGERESRRAAPKRAAGTGCTLMWTRLISNQAN